MSLHHELVSKGYKFSLPQISTMASNLWKNESDEVKQAYNDLVNNAKIFMSFLNDKSNTFNYENNNDLNGAVPHNSITTGENPPNGTNVTTTVVEPYSSSEFISSRNRFPFNNSYSSLNNNLVVPESSSINERFRVIEERQKLFAEKLGVQF
ncbi:hypothetical protein C1645_764439 [Glomus cerebriforme]|uniref:Uncharacterized protein n=1 Tax=Glomus cerebriforme TaxID=658196 RepID=A0A397T8P9_9GLOM|nr:hypothetical protein C1645_764439 [Glomus cerebriforme]